MLLCLTLTCLILFMSFIPSSPQTPLETEKGDKGRDSKEDPAKQISTSEPPTSRYATGHAKGLSVLSDFHQSSLLPMTSDSGIRGRIWFGGTFQLAPDPRPCDLGPEKDKHSIMQTSIVSSYPDWLDGGGD